MTRVIAWPAPHIPRVYQASVRRLDPCVAFWVSPCVAQRRAGIWARRPISAPGLRYLSSSLSRRASR